MLTKVFYLLLFIFSFQLCQAQNYTIKKEAQTKVFDKDTFYDLSFSNTSKDCCDNQIFGTINRIYKDSLQIKVLDITVTNEGSGFSKKIIINKDEESFLLKLPKSDLQALTAYKTEKSFSKKNGWKVVGGLLAVTGLITLANSYDIQENSFREGVLISSGAQLGFGVLFIALNGKKKYQLKDGWQF